MDAVVLVGGKGTRLRPLTVGRPKPMLPTAGVPFLEHLLCRARDGGITRVVLSTSYRAEVFHDAFGDGSRLGLEVVYVHEETPLGTGGGIRNAASALTAAPDEPVVVFNGDILSGLDVTHLVDAHTESGAVVTLHLTRVDDPRAFGLVPTDDDGRVLEFREKPQTPEEIVTDQVNAGCYVFRRDVLEAIPAGRPVSVERETFPGLLSDGAHLHGHVETSYWADLGTPTTFVAGCTHLVTGRAPSTALPGRTGEALLLDGAEVAADAQVTGGTTVGRGCRVGAGAVVEASVLLDGAVVAAGAVVRRSALGVDAEVGAGAVLEDAAVGDRAVVGARCELLSGARVWPDVVLPEAGVRFSSDE